MSRGVVCILSAVLCFTDKLFLFCKIANLEDIDLKFSESISNVNIGNPAKFRDVSIPRSCISKNRDFRDFGL